MASGRGHAATVAAHALDELRLEKERHRVPDPVEFGDERDGLMPGEWLPDELGLPPDCPVRPLGVNGPNHYFIDEQGQLAVLHPNSWGQGMTQALFGRRQAYLVWAFPMKNKKGRVTGFDTVWARRTLIAACAEKGLWSDAESVRGAGAWLDGDDLIFHCGKFLYRASTGRLSHPGEIDALFYPQRPAIVRPWRQPVEGEANPAPAILRILHTWQWVRPRVDPLLMLGWIGAAILSGALPWRPSLFLVGDKAVGKTTLQHIVKAILGPMLVQTADTTSAGIYNRLQNDALPVAIDELEAEADNTKVKAVVRLAQLSSSGELMLRGSQMQKGVEFQARSCFLMSAINPPPMTPAQISRVAILHTRRLDPEKAKAAPVLKDADTILPKLMRLLADAWGNFGALYQAYRDVLRPGGLDNRLQETFGSLLTCAHMMLGDEGMVEAGYPSSDDLSAWTNDLGIHVLPEHADNSENWRKCIVHLLTSRVEAWYRSNRGAVGELLRELVEEGDEEGALQLSTARKLLGQAGLGILDWRGPHAKHAAYSKCGYVLAVPNSGSLIAQQFRNTTWGGEGAVGVWSSALRQGPEDVFIRDPHVNNVKINGVPQRCTLVRLDQLDQLLWRE